MSLEHNQLEEIHDLRAALENILNRSKRSTETYFIWKVAQEALDSDEEFEGLNQT